MSLGTIVVTILIIVLIGALPAWPHSKDWGFAPGGALGLILVIILILWLAGRL